MDSDEQSVLGVIAGRALKTAAARLLVYEPQMVPALLQTEPYALDVATTAPACAPAASSGRPRRS